MSAERQIFCSLADTRVSAGPHTRAPLHSVIVIIIILNTGNV